MSLLYCALRKYAVYFYWIFSISTEWNRVNWLSNKTKFVRIKILAGGFVSLSIALWFGYHPKWRGKLSLMNRRIRTGFFHFKKFSIFNELNMFSRRYYKCSCLYVKHSNYVHMPVSRASYQTMHVYSGLLSWAMRTWKATPVIGNCLCANTVLHSISPEKPGKTHTEAPIMNRGL